jgi:outer membrane protein assembly factor BamD (BamD/ComL family)
MKHPLFIQKITVFSFSIIISAIGILSCKSVPVVITDDMPSKELIQKGQDAYQNNNYKNAFIYYQAVIDRFGTDQASYIEARYEIGHLYMKQKKYKEAEPVFNEIKDIFRNSLPGTLPAAYNKLADIELEKIPVRKAAAAKAAAEQQKANIQTPDQY